MTLAVSVVVAAAAFPLLVLIRAGVVSRHRSLRFTLLDQQVVAAEDRPVGRVDDVELELDEPGAPHLADQAQGKLRVRASPLAPLLA